MAGEKTIISNRHPSYSSWVEQWSFFKHSYLGGADYISENLFRYFKEGDQEFIGRAKRAYRENHTKRVVDLINTYLFKAQAVRETENTLIAEFMDDIDGRGKTADRFMKTASQWASVMGRVYIVVDKMPIPEEQKTGTQADNLKSKPYCYLIFPQDVLDIAFDDAGRVKWALIRESYRDDSDPFTASQTVEVQYRLWEVAKWTLFDDAGKDIDKGETGLDCVPIIILDNEEQEEYAGQSLISDIAYIDRAIFNNWSRLDTIVCDQTFSQLIFPIEGLAADIITDDNLRQQFMTLATNRIILYSAQAQAAPAFISPDASQAQFILTMIERQTKQLYATLGLQSETGTESNTQSGVAKAFDFDKLNKLLANKADNLEQAEWEVYSIGAKWMGITGDVDVLVDYPEEFDVKTLADEIKVAQELALLDISVTFTKEINKLIVQKAIPKAEDKTIKDIYAEIDAGAEPEKDAIKKSVFPFDKKDTEKEE